MDLTTSLKEGKSTARCLESGLAAQRRGCDIENIVLQHVGVYCVPYLGGKEKKLKKPLDGQDAALQVRVIFDVQSIDTYLEP